jgi:hypothetical protein
MQLLDVEATGTNHEYLWPSGDTEIYEHWIQYRAVSAEGERHIRIGFGTRPAYGQDRKRMVMWIDDYPHPEFLGDDDFEVTGNVLSEIRVPGEKEQRICRYAEESVPPRYADLNVVGLRTRVSSPNLHNAWAAVGNIADHKTLFALAALRLRERER